MTRSRNRTPDLGVRFRGGHELGQAYTGPDRRTRAFVRTVGTATGLKPLNVTSRVQPLAQPGSLHEHPSPSG